MKIEDNFLVQEEFDELQALIMGEEFAWYYKGHIDYEEQKNKFQFIHMFYGDYTYQSVFCEKLDPIFNKIIPISILRIKANLLTRTSNIKVNIFHVDPFTDMGEEKMKQWTTSIFYMNTNNGYTEFEDGTIVESVANRMVIFPANLKHRGTTCTDQQTRVVINFNYLSAPDPTTLRKP